MIEVLECLKKHGQRLDLEIAKETARRSQLCVATCRASS